MKRHIEINVMTTEELVKAESIINRAFRRCYNVYGAHRDYYSESREHDLHLLQLTLEASWGNKWKEWVKAAIIPQLLKENFEYSKLYKSLAVHPIPAKLSPISESSIIGISFIK